MKLTLKLLLPLAAVALLIASCSGGKYETVKGDPMKTRIYTLDNGLKVFMSVNKETPRVQAGIAVRVGGKNDPAETTGLAHYFEHIMFKGTERLGTQDYAAEKVILDQIEQQFEYYRTLTDEAERKEAYRVIDSLSFEASKYAVPNEYAKLMSVIGSEGTNAFTAMDMTVYIENVPSNQLENWAIIQADRFKTPVIRGFHTELETVYEEKNMSLTQDNRKVYEAVNEALYPDHPYGTQTVLGTQEHLKNPSITNIKNYHKTWYVPNNMAVILVGDFDYDEALALIKDNFGDMVPNYDLPEMPKNAEFRINTPIERNVLGLEAENVNIAWRTVGATDPDAELLDFVGAILFNGTAGMMDLNLLQQQKILSGYAYASAQADHGMFLISARPKAGQSLEELRDLLLEQVRMLKAGDFDEQLLQSTINNYKAMKMRELDSNWGRFSSIMYAYINGMDWKNVVTMFDRMNGVTKEQLVATANKYLGDNNYAVVYKRQGKDPDEVTIAKPEITPLMTNRDAESDFFRELRLKEVKPIEPVFLDFDRDMGKLKAKSDLEVLYVQNKNNDLFYLAYIFETGQNNDPASNLAFDYLDYLGTSDMTIEEVQQEFYRIACSFWVSAGADRSYIVLTGLSENMDRAMELMESLLNDPKANEEALENMKMDLMQRRFNAKLSQSDNFNRLRQYAYYGPKSPATNVLSNEEISAITTQDLLDRIKSLGQMEHRVMYYGPLGTNEIVKNINTYHNIPEKLSPVPDPVKYPFLETPVNRILLAHYDAPQIYYAQYSNRGEKFSVANDPMISMYNEYFGGGMNAIVFQEMREARALAYTSYAFLAPPNELDKPYTMFAFIATQNDKMVDAIEAFEEIINDMPESEPAFEMAKESLLNSIRTERIIKESILWTYISLQDLGLEHDRRKNIFENVQHITLDDLKAFQQEWVKGRTYTFGILGDESKLDIDALKKYGPVQRVTQEELFGY